MLEEAVFVQGPLHPDLFDGMTPMIFQVEPAAVEELRSFVVEAEYSMTFLFMPRIIARTEAEARERCMSALRGKNADSYEVVAVSDVCRPPSPKEIQDYFDLQISRETRHD